MASDLNAGDSSDADLARLVDAVSRLRLASIPPAILDHAAWVFADTIGAIMGGMGQPEMRALVTAGGELIPDAGPPADVLAPGLPRRGAATAAFLNGTAATFLELDQGMRPTGHPAAHVVPAALAAAQAAHRSGSELLEAFVAGYEVCGRLFSHYRLRYPVHPHGHLGAVGAAVAAALALGREPLGPALIAGTLPLLTVWQPCYEGATARNCWTGVAGMVGLLANRLDQAGFTGSRQLLPAAFGEVAGDVRDDSPLADPVDGARLLIARDYLKLHSACALSHGALDAVLSLGPISHADVERVEVETVSNNLKLDRQAVANPLSNRFSLQHSVAAAIVHGHTRPEAFQNDERATALAGRVTVRAAPDLEARWPEESPARVTVHLRGGQLRAESSNPRGHHLNPAPEAELRAKFEMLSWFEPAGRLHARLLDVTSIEDVADLFPSAIRD